MLCHWHAQYSFFIGSTQQLPFFNSASMKVARRGLVKIKIKQNNLFYHKDQCQSNNPNVMWVHFDVEIAWTGSPHIFVLWFLCSVFTLQSQKQSPSQLCHTLCLVANLLIIHSRTSFHNYLSQLLSTFTEHLTSLDETT